LNTLNSAGNAYPISCDISRTDKSLINLSVIVAKYHRDTVVQHDTMGCKMNQKGMPTEQGEHK